MLPIAEAVTINLDVSQSLLFPPAFRTRPERITNVLIDNVGIEICETRNAKGYFGNQ